MNLLCKNETGMVLVYDEELGRYILEFDATGGQKTIFDPEYQKSGNTIDADARQVDEEEVKGIPMLESADKAAGSEPEVVDVECEETQVEDDSNGADGDIEAGEESDYEYD